MKDIDAINEFIKRGYIEHLKREKEAIEKQATFISKFTVEKILRFSKNEYFDFCHCLRYDMKCMASMGDSRPSCFGIYKPQETGIITLSKTYKNIFGENIEAAFISIKNDVVDLIKAAENDDYDSVRKSRVHSNFKYKLLNVYFPNKFFPVCTKSTMALYCSIIGYEVEDNDVDFIDNAILLREWRDSFDESVEWTDLTLMGFFVWVKNNNKYFSKSTTNEKTQRLAESETITSYVKDLGLVGLEREIITKQRVNQSTFRQKLLKKYIKCCLCSVSGKELLIASHIKPWSHCEPIERLDSENGLLLCPNHDRLFDLGLISFDENGLIMISEKLSDNDAKAIGLGMQRIVMSDRMGNYMNFHRDLYGYNE